MTNSLVIICSSIDEVKLYVSLESKQRELNSPYVVKYILLPNHQRQGLTFISHTC